MSIIEDINSKSFIEQGWGHMYPVLNSLCERIMYRHYSGYASTFKEDLIQEGLLKAHSLIANGKFDGRSSLYNYLYTGIRNAMGNYLYHGTKQVLLIEGDEAELLCETRIDISSEMKGLDPESFPGRCHLVKKLEEDDLFNAWDDVPQDELNLFLEIIGIRTNFKDAIPLRDAGVPRVAMIFLFLFAGKNVKLPSDDLLEKYQRHARVYSLHLRGHSDDEIGKIVGLRKVHITRIISSVKQTLGNTNGYNKIPEEPPGAASQSE